MSNHFRCGTGANEDHAANLQQLAEDKTLPPNVRYTIMKAREALIKLQTPPTTDAQNLVGLLDRGYREWNGQ